MRKNLVLLALALVTALVLGMSTNVFAWPGGETPTAQSPTTQETTLQATPGTTTLVTAGVSITSPTTTTVRHKPRPRTRISVALPFTGLLVNPFLFAAGGIVLLALSGIAGMKRHNDEDDD